MQSRLAPYSVSLCVAFAILLVTEYVPAQSTEGDQFLDGIGETARRQVRAGW